MCEAVVTLSRDVSKQEEFASSDDICWICHEGHSAELPLAEPCKCSCLKAHRPCLARWQLQQAGRSEEHYCRFCKTQLPDWRDAHSELPKAPPIMTVVHNGVTQQVTVEPGPDGRERFQSEIRKNFNLGENDAIQLTFGCRVPGTGHEITLEGWEAFDAAVHCAAISAGQRMQADREKEHKRKPKAERKVSTPPGGILRRLFSRTSSQQGA